MVDKFGFATFRTKDGRMLVGRVIGIGERLATVKAIGLGSVHRVAHQNLAKVVLPLSIDEMAAKNLNAKSAADRKKEVDNAMKRKRREQIAQWDRDGYPDRYEFMDGTTH